MPFSSQTISEMLLEIHTMQKFAFSQTINSFKITLKALGTTAADDIHKYFFIVFQGK